MIKKQSVKITIFFQIGLYYIVCTTSCSRVSQESFKDLQVPTRRLLLCGIDECLCQLVVSCQKRVHLSSKLKAKMEEHRLNQQQAQVEWTQELTLTGLKTRRRRRQQHLTLMLLQNRPTETPTMNAHRRQCQTNKIEMSFFYCNLWLRWLLETTLKLFEVWLEKRHLHQWLNCFYIVRELSILCHLWLMA